MCGNWKVKSDCEFGVTLTRSAVGVPRAGSCSSSRAGEMDKGQHE